MKCKIIENHDHTAIIGYFENGIVTLNLGCEITLEQAYAAFGSTFEILDRRSSGKINRIRITHFSVDRRVK